MTQNQINYWKAQYEHLDRMRSQKEVERSNLIYEAETKRHNLESELIGLQQAKASLASAAAAARNAAAQERNARTNEYVAQLEQSRKERLQEYVEKQYVSDIAYRDSQTVESLARAGLITAQTTTEYSRQANLDAQTVRQLTGVATDVAGTLVNIIGAFAR